MQRRLPQHAPADLDHTRTTGISLRQAVGDNAGSGGAVERETGVARVEDVEDVNRISANLELRSFIDSNVTEDRGIHVSHARPVQRINSQCAI